MFFVNIALITARRISALDEAHYYYRTNIKGSLQANNDKTPLMFFESWKAIHQKLHSLGTFNYVYKSWVPAVFHSSLHNLLSLKSEYNFRLVYDLLRREIFPFLFGKRLSGEELSDKDWLMQYNALMDNENPVLFMMLRNQYEQKIQQNLKKAIAQHDQSCNSKSSSQGKTEDIDKLHKELSIEKTKSTNRIASLEKQIRGLSFEVNALRTSEAYRTVMFITWPARKAWGGVKCWRDNGFKYTVKHFFGKIARRLGFKDVKW